jgi:CheY-like chemotaxis protein
VQLLGLKEVFSMARILIADDEPMIALLLADWLEELGHETAGPVRNVASALSLIASKPLDAAIVDVGLGRETGYPIAARLAELGIPFVFATGQAEGTLQAPFTNARILSKPFDFAGVEAALAQMLGKASR